MIWPFSFLIAVFPESGAKTPALPGTSSSTILETRHTVPAGGMPVGLPFSRRTIAAPVIGHSPITVSRVSTLATVPDGGNVNMPLGVIRVISCGVRFNTAFSKRKSRQRTGRETVCYADLAGSPHSKKPAFAGFGAGNQPALGSAAFCKAAASCRASHSACETA
jgi:hypothetical protein